jgi:diaminopimelate decarboxylase
VAEITYRDGTLCVEGVTLDRIAEAVGTPAYVYSAAAIEGAWRRFSAAFEGQPDVSICYALKANSNLAVVALLARLGAGADVVSEGELRRALAAGVPPARIVFSGVGKTREEMAFALETGVHQINVESLNELEALSEVAVRLGRRARVAIRINPDVDALTHAKISTGKAENKFGIDLAHAPAAFRRAAALPGIEPAAVAVHIGSQLTSIDPFRLAFTRIAQLVPRLRAEGIAISGLDLGGGLGIRYRGETPPDLDAYAAMVKEVTAGLGCTLTFEPGRLLVGNAGLLLARVLYVKAGATRRFLVLDAAMNDLIRPALYEAFHDIVPVRQAPGKVEKTPVDVVGPVCESGDTFATQRLLPPFMEGDLAALLSAGAYGAVMSSTYNSRLMVPEVLVHGDRFDVIRPRQTYEELLALDRVPAWLKGGAA